MDVGAERHGQDRRRPLEPLVGEEGAQADRRSLAVGHLDAEGRAPGHAVDAHRLGLERQREVVLEVDDLRHLDARRRLQLVDGDDRPGADPFDRPLDAELGAARADDLAQPHQLALVDAAARLLEREEVDRRQGAGGGGRGGEERLLSRIARRARRGAALGGGGARAGRGARPLGGEVQLVEVLVRGGGHAAERQVAVGAAAGDSPQRQIDPAAGGRRRHAARDDRRQYRLLLPLLLLGRALQVLGDDAAARRLLRLALLAPGAGELPLLPAVGESGAPGAQHVVERGLHGEETAGQERHEEDEERAREVEPGEEQLREHDPEGAAGGDRRLPPRDLGDEHLEQGRQRGEEEQRADAAPHDLLAVAAAEAAPTADQQEERHGEARGAEELEGEGGDLRPHRPGRVAGPRGVRDGAVEEARVLGVVGAEREPEEERQGDEEDAQQLAALLRREGRRRGAALPADDQRHVGLGAQVRFRFQVKDWGLTSDEV